MKKTFSFGILTIGLVMLVGILRSKQEKDGKESVFQKNIIFDTINDDPIGI